MAEQKSEKGSVESRLNLVRYGMIIIVVLAFGITAAYSMFANLGAIMPSLVSGLIAAVVAAVAMVAVYFGYAAFLKRGQ